MSALPSKSPCADCLWPCRSCASSWVPFCFERCAAWWFAWWSGARGTCSWTDLFQALRSCSTSTGYLAATAARSTWWLGCPMYVVSSSSELRSSWSGRTRAAFGSFRLCAFSRYTGSRTLSLLAWTSFRLSSNPVSCTFQSHFTLQGSLSELSWS